MDHSYARNDLTNFECEAPAIIENGNYLKMLEYA